MAGQQQLKEKQRAMVQPALPKLLVERNIPTSKASAKGSTIIATEISVHHTKSISHFPKNLNHINSSSQSSQIHGVKVSSNQLLSPNQTTNFAPQVSKPCRHKSSTACQPTPKVSASIHRSPLEQLRWLQEREIRQIGYRNQNAGCINPTTSLTDLDLARRPFKEDKKFKEGEALYKHVAKIKAAILSSTTDKATTNTASSGDASSSLNGVSLENNIESVSRKCSQMKSATTLEVHEHKAGRGSANKISQNKVSNHLPDLEDLSVGTEDSLRPMNSAETSNTKRFDSVKPTVKPAKTVAMTFYFKVDEAERIFKPSINDWMMHSDWFALKSLSSTKNLNGISFQEAYELDACPDGIGFVSKTFSLNSKNLRQYGYHPELENLTKDCKALTEDDLNQKISMDRESPQNALVLTETTEDLVKNWNAHKRRFQILKFMETHSWAHYSESNEEQDSLQQPHSKPC